MKILFYSVFALFVLKIVLNFIVPYELLIQRARLKTGRRSFSLAPVIFWEWLFLLIGFGVSFAVELRNITPLRVACFGIVAIIFSYLHFAVVFAVARFRLESRSSKSDSKATPEPEVEKKD